jgi:hypothetical protein
VGYFLSVSAFRGTEVGALRDAIAAYAGEHGVSVAPVDGRDDDHRDISLFAGDWAVVLWPEHFNVHDVPACARLSADLGTLVSAIHTFDGDYWVHNVFRDGERLDRFASMPDYFTDTGATRWAGDPARVAAAFGRAPEQVAPYYVHQSVHAEEPAGKAFGDDEFDLDNMWVFADLWRRLGIAYPEDMGATAACLRLAEGWEDRLPVDPDGDGL